MGKCCIYDEGCLFNGFNCHCWLVCTCALVRIYILHILKASRRGRLGWANACHFWAPPIHFFNVLFGAFWIKWSVKLEGLIFVQICWAEFWNLFPCSFLENFIFNNLPEIVVFEPLQSCWLKNPSCFPIVTVKEAVNHLLMKLWDFQISSSGVLKKQQKTCFWLSCVHLPCEKQNWFVL